MYNSALNAVLAPVLPASGESGYFSAPSETLDPHLFEGGNKNQFRPEVRNWILNTLYGYWSKYNNARSWSTVWIAGSGISYQWSASRGNGDLDVLIGVKFPEFFEDNPRFDGLSENDMADIFNKEFHAELWPKTADTEFSSTVQGDMKQTYEVTFYVNPGSTDIRDIHPYAAFDLTHNRWTVDPPSGPDFQHPEEYYRYAEDERRVADGVVAQYNQFASQAQTQAPGSPQWHNSMHMADTVAAQAQNMFDNIHLGRKQAFGPSGSGFGDFYNFRWQFHKKNGTVQTLRAVGQAHEAVRAAYAESVYGGPIDAADVALRRAALWNRGGNGR